MKHESRHHKQETHSESPKPSDTKTKPLSPAKSPHDTVAKNFFYAIIESSKKGQVNIEDEELKRSQSENDVSQPQPEIEAELPEKQALGRSRSLDIDSSEGRPRSTSPTVESVSEVEESEKPSGTEVGNAESSAPSESAEKEGKEVVNKQDSTKNSTEPESKETNKRKSLPQHRSLDLDIGGDKSLQSTYIGSPGSETTSKDESNKPTLPVNGVVQEPTADEQEPLPSPSRPRVKPYVDIPEFTWSPLHQRLLTELLFAIENDIHVWRT